MNTTSQNITLTTDGDSNLRAISRHEVAQRLGISMSLTRDLLRSGELKSCRIGRRVVVPVAALRDFLER
jgi:excisionase family DNA binding protein